MTDRKYDTMILGDNIITTFDSNKTSLNNNTVVIGATGTGKSVSVTEAQMLHTYENSLIITTVKRTLVYKYTPIFRNRGYRVEVMNLSDAKLSTCGFDPLRYASSPQDLEELAHSIIGLSGEQSWQKDPYWTDAATAMIAAELSLAVEQWAYSDEELPSPSMDNVLSLHRILKFTEASSGFTRSTLDVSFSELERITDGKSPAVGYWKTVQGLAAKTVSCVLSTATTMYNKVFSSEIQKIMKKKPIDIEGLGKEKSVLFIVTSPVNVSQQCYANLLYSWIFKLLYNSAERNPDFRLNKNVHFICDDFACGAKIPKFEEYISVFRSAGISATLILQSFTQLENMYGPQAASIIYDNCDRTIFLGSSDISTCNVIAKKANYPFNRVLQMTPGKAIIMERGNKAFFTSRYNTFEDEIYRREFLENEYENQL